MLRNKILALLMAAGLLVAAGCSRNDVVAPVRDGDEAVVQDGEDEGGSAAGQPSAYMMFAKANSAYEEAESYAMAYTMDIGMELEGETYNQSVKGDVKMSAEGDEILFSMSMNTSVEGQTVDMDAFYTDGYYYMESMGQKMKVAMPFDQAMAQASALGTSFDESMIKEQSVSGNTLTFVLDGKAMNDFLGDQMDEMMAGMGASDVSLSYGDITYIVTLKDNGDLDGMKMTGTMTVSDEDVTVTADIDMTMTVTQIGGVTVEIPDDLDSYVEVSM